MKEEQRSGELSMGLADTSVNTTHSSPTITAILGFSGGGYAVAGALLLFLPKWFYQNIGYFPPLNHHYAGDLGTSLLPLGVALCLAIRQPVQYTKVVGVAAGFSTLHMINHIRDAISGHAPPVGWAWDVGPIALSAVLLIYIYFRLRKIKGASDHA